MSQQKKVLNEELERERAWNKKHIVELNAHQALLRRFEVEAKKYGLELNAVFDVRRP